MCARVVGKAVRIRCRVELLLGMPRSRRVTLVAMCAVVCIAAAALSLHAARAVAHDIAAAQLALTVMPTPSSFSSAPPPPTASPTASAAPELRCHGHTWWDGPKLSMDEASAWLRTDTPPPPYQDDDPPPSLNATASDDDCHLLDARSVAQRFKRCIRRHVRVDHSNSTVVMASLLAPLVAILRDRVVTPRRTSMFNGRDCTSLNPATVVEDFQGYCVRIACTRPDGIAADAPSTVSVTVHALYLEALQHAPDRVRRHADALLRELRSGAAAAANGLCATVALDPLFVFMRLGEPDVSRREPPAEKFTQFWAARPHFAVAGLRRLRTQPHVANASATPALRSDATVLLFGPHFEAFSQPTDAPQLQKLYLDAEAAGMKRDDAAQFHRTADAADSVCSIPAARRVWEHERASEVAWCGDLRAASTEAVAGTDPETAVTQSGLRRHVKVRFASESDVAARHVCRVPALTADMQRNGAGIVHRLGNVRGVVVPSDTAVVAERFRRLVYATSGAPVFELSVAAGSPLLPPTLARYHVTVAGATLPDYLWQPWRHFVPLVVPAGVETSRTARDVVVSALTSAVFDAEERLEGVAHSVRVRFRHVADARFRAAYCANVLALLAAAR